jgi:hypothetical protein
MQIDTAQVFGRTLIDLESRRRDENTASQLAAQAKHALLLNDFAKRLADTLTGPNLAAEQIQRLVMSLERLADGLRGA